MAVRGVERVVPEVELTRADRVRRRPGARRGVRRVAVAALVVLTAGGAGLVGHGTVARAGAATTSRCATSNVTGSASERTIPGGAWVTVRLTNHRVGGCWWLGRLATEWLDAGGHVVGSATARPVGPEWVGYLNQLSVTVSTMEGVHCAQRRATDVAVVLGTRILVPLARPIGVCQGTAATWSVVHATGVVAVARCARLRVTVGPPNGAAGTTWYPVIFTNPGRTACEVAGWPRVVPVRSASSANAVGPPALRERLYGGAIRLLPGAHASAALGAVETDDYTPAACVARRATGLDVTLGAVRATVRLDLSVCTRTASVRIEGLVPGASGTA